MYASAIFNTIITEQPMNKSIHTDLATVPVLVSLKQQTGSIILTMLLFYSLVCFPLLFLDLEALIGSFFQTWATQNQRISFFSRRFTKQEPNASTAVDDCRTVGRTECPLH
jgi:hypothetical protein